MIGLLMHQNCRRTLPSVALLTLVSKASLIWEKLYVAMVEVARSPFRQDEYSLRIFYLSSFGQTPQKVDKQKPVTVRPEKNLEAVLKTSGSLVSIPQMYTVAGRARPSIRCRVTSPPPRASKQASNLALLNNYLYCGCQSPSVTKTCSAPSERKRSACSFLLTTFKRGILFVWQILLSCLPRAEAAAVWIIPECPFVLTCQMKPKTVKGFTTPEAAEESGTSSSMTKQRLLVAYSDQLPVPVKNDTLFPTRCS